VQAERNIGAWNNIGHGLFERFLNRATELL
jgi:hypothetical protein